MASARQNSKAATAGLVFSPRLAEAEAGVLDWPVLVLMEASPHPARAAQAEQPTMEAVVLVVRAHMAAQRL